MLNVSALCINEQFVTWEVLHAIQRLFEGRGRRCAVICQRCCRLAWDLVTLHIHSQRSPDIRGNAVVDMFRIEDGKVAEHWDVVQGPGAVPERKHDVLMQDAAGCW